LDVESDVKDAFTEADVKRLERYMQAIAKLWL
jgi:putative methionine-R-sulfoxide reductase with GAF domain